MYIALPNHIASMQARAAEAGIDVLCEKLLAVTEDECRAMIDAAAANAVKRAVRIGTEARLFGSVSGNKSHSWKN